MARRKRLAVPGESPASGPQNLSSRVGWLLGLCFVVLNLVLAGYFLDSIPSPNPTSRALPVLTLTEGDGYVIDAYEKETIDKSFVNGHYYPDKAPLTTWIVVPFYAVLKWLNAAEPAAGKLRWLPIIWLGDVLCGTLPFVLLLWLILQRLNRTVPAHEAILLCMLPLYGSFIFGYAGVYMGHLVAGVLLCGSYALLMSRRWPALAGCLLGLAVLTEYPVALAIPIWAWVIFRRAGRRELVPFALGGLPAAAAMLLYNHTITGSYLKMPYAFEAIGSFSQQMQSAYGIRLPQIEALWGLLFSEYRGLFFYAPALAVLAVWYVLTKRSQLLRETLTTPLGILSVAYVLLMSSYFVWWGGWAFGPRHLIPLAMLLFYEGIPAFARAGRFRGWLYAASLAGIGMAWLVKSTTLYIMPEQYSSPVFDLVWPAFLARRLRQDAIPAQFFGVDPLLAAWIWVGLFIISIAALRFLAQRRDRALDSRS